MKSSSIVVAMLALVFASGAFAQHTFAPFTVTPVGTTNFDTVLNVASVPAGTYSSFQVTVSWTAIAGNPFSNEARTSFTNGGATTHFAEAAPTTGGASNGNPATLTWTANFAVPYVAGNPLTHRARQTFGGSTATWTNVTITLIPAPGDPEINVQNPAAATVFSGGIYAAGSLVTGLGQAMTFTVQNQGATQNLNVSSISAAPSGVANCGITPAAPTLTTNPVAPAGSATFTVTLTPTAGGAFEATLTINSNDANEGTYTVLIQGTGVAPLALPVLENYDTWTTDTTNPVPLPSNWVNETTGGVNDWFILAGATPSGNTGPDIDQSTGTAAGHYVYFEDSNGQNAGDVVMLSPVINLGSATNPTLTFWFHANDANGVAASNNTLHIDVVNRTTSTTTNDVTAVIQHVAANGTTWTLRSVSLSAFVGNMIQVRFRVDDAGNSFTHDIAIDTFRVFDFLPNDVGVLSIDTPASGVGLSATETVSVTIRNYGAASQSNFPVSFTVNGGTPVTETFTATIPSLTNATFTFTGTADLSTPSTTYTIVAATALSGDGAASNDSATKVVRHVGTVTSFPYSEDFEGASAADWTVAGTTTTWALGTPAKAVINAAASGTNAWVTSIAGNYLDNENGAVISPAFNLSSFTSDPWVSIAVWWEAEFSWDGAVLQSSIDNQASWQTVGAFGDPNNWYTDNSVAGLSAGSGQQSGWSGRNDTTNGSNGWVTALHSLTGLGGQSQVFFRVVFGSDTTVVDDGFAFDDFMIGNPAEIDVLRNTVSVPHRGTVNTGNVLFAAGGQQTFDVENQGDFTLNLTGTAPDYVVVTPGTNIATVIVTTQPNPAITGGSSETFVIDYTFTAPGAFDFTVTIPNDDASPVVYDTGTDGVLTLATNNFASATANFTAADVGAQIVITGSTGGNDGTYIIQSVNSATDVTLTTSPTADESALAWSHEDSEAGYTFTVSGTAIVNAPPTLDLATGSSFVAGADFDLTVAPGAALSQATLEADDPTPDPLDITVSFSTGPQGSTPPTGITAPAGGVGISALPFALTWTGTADATNDPGTYLWEVTLEDGVSTVIFDVRITITDAAPTHVAASGISGDGLTGATAYTADVQIGSAGAVDIADCDDANLGQSITVFSQVQTAAPSGLTWTFAMTGTNPSTLTVTPSAAPALADVGDFDYTVVIEDDNGNQATIFVTITVDGIAPTITSAAAPTTATDGLAFSHQFTATGNPAPTFAVTTGTLPGWATLTPAGLLSGTAVLGQDINVTVSAQNGIGADDTEAVTVTVVTGVPPTITSALAPATATVGTLYTHTFTATGTPAPTFSATGLPTWLTLNPTSGLLTGTPAAGDVGTAGPIIVTATNGVNPDDTETFSIVVSSGGGGGGGDGGGDDGGGCSTDNSNYGWLALLGLLSVVAVVTRLRGSRS
jgi:hypothetical protein